MFRKLSITTRTLALAAAICGLSFGSAFSLRANTGQPVDQTPDGDSWPNQCYNSDGSLTCPICGSTCLGGNYLCCNNRG